MANIVITIGREYGSGGREIGEKLAKELGFTFYDKEHTVLRTLIFRNMLTPEHISVDKNTFCCLRTSCAIFLLYAK